MKFGPGVIRPEFFELEAEREVCKALHKFYSQYNRPPCEDELEAMLVGKDGVSELVCSIYDLATDGDLEYAADNVIKFAQEQAMKLAILDSVGDIEGGNLSKPLERCRQALTVGLDITDVGLELKKDMSWAYAEAMSVKMQTGIHHMDALLEGGLGRGELGVIMAPTNVGKTMALVNIGCGAAGIMGKATVVHITVELSAKKVAKRYAARTVFKWLKRENDPSEYIMEFQDSAHKRMPGNVYIKEWPTGNASINDIDAYLERLKLLGIVADVVIVDYPDELRHAGVGEYRLILGRTFSELRALAIKWDVALWGATQAGRQALAKEMVTLDDISESMEKANKSDVIVAVCQTRLEKEDNVLRLFGAKVRDGEGGWMVQCHLSKDAHAIISDKVITFRELAEERERREEAVKSRL